MSILRTAVLQLAHANPKLRKHLVPVLRKTADAVITERMFESLRPGNRFKATVADPGVAGEIEFVVGRTSYSKKHDVYSKVIVPIGDDGTPVKGRAKWVLYKRSGGRVSMAHGNMGVAVKSVRF